MKNLFQSFPNLSRLILTVLLFAAALAIASFVNIPGLQEIFPFVGLLLVVLATWVLYRTENKNLDELGFNLQSRNLTFLPIGLVLGILAVLLGYYLKSFLTGDTIYFNPDLEYFSILKHLYWVLPTAAVQEFLCRGYVYKKMISATNLTVANIVLGLVFISMHDVFNIGIFGAIFYSISLIIGHLVFATALLKSGTIFFAIGIHWGSNLANNQLFTDDKITSSIFYLEKAVQEEPAGPNPLGILLYILALNIGFILLGILISKWKGWRGNPSLG